MIQGLGLTATEPPDLSSGGGRRHWEHFLTYEARRSAMTITVQCKLDLTGEQRSAIDNTMEAFAAACNDALNVGREAGTTSNVRIHDRYDYDLREDHGLPANLAVRAIARAAGILKGKERRPSTVRPTSIDYDARTFSFKEADGSISLSTTQGRQKPIALDIGDYQRNVLEGQPKSAVVFKKRINGDWTYYAGIHIDVEEPPADLDDGTSFSGEEVDRVRDRYNRTRASLQSKGTTGCKKVLRRLRGRERRFQQSVNHRISKRIVEKARAEGKGVRVEDLSGIRGRMRVRRSQRYRHHSWAFYQLQTFIRYKCALAGVPFEAVDAAYTSRTCPECGHQDKANRKSQDRFVCQACGHEENADVVGACQPPQDERQEVASEAGVGIPA